MTEPVVPKTTDRVDPPLAATERGMLDSWLEFHRATLLTKCEGLTEEELKTRSVPPSSMSLLGLVRHMTDVERNWFRRVLAAEAAEPLYYSDLNRDGEFDDVAAADVNGDLARFLDEIDHCRRVAAEHQDLDTMGKGHRGEPPLEFSLRWIYVHMIEEYARHNGHADFLRERIDGATGV